MSDYPRVPVHIQDFPESHRRLSQAVNYLLEANTGGAIFSDVSDTVLIPGFVDVWNFGSGIETDFQINQATGEMTTLKEGLVVFNGSMSMSGSGLQNNSYTLELWKNGVFERVMDSIFWSAQQVIATFSGSAVEFAQPDDVWRLYINSTNTGALITLDGAEFYANYWTYLDVA